MADSLGTLVVRIAADIKELEAGLNQAAGSTRAATSNMQSSLDSLEQKALMAAKAMAVLWVTDKAVAAVKEMAMLNARYEELGVVMAVVGKNAGYNAQEMNQAALGMQKAGITMLESRNTAVQLAQAQINLADSSKLARIAQDAAVIGNINSSEALKSMIYGIKSGQIDVLRTIGINVNFEQSYKSLATQLGVTTEALSEKQKMQARENAVLAEGEKLVGAYEAAMGTAGKQMRSMTRYLEDLKVMRGEVFNEALTVGVMAFVDQLKDANGEVTTLANNGKLKEWGNDVADTFAFVVDAGLSVISVTKMISATVGWMMARAANGNTAGTTREQLAATSKAIDDAYLEDLDRLRNGTSIMRDALEKRRGAQKADADKRVAIEADYAQRVIAIQNQLANYNPAVNQQAQLALRKSMFPQDYPTAPKDAPATPTATKHEAASAYDTLSEAIARELSLADEELKYGGKLVASDKYRVQTLDKVTNAYANDKITMKEWSDLYDKTIKTSERMAEVEAVKASEKAYAEADAARTKFTEGLTAGLDKLQQETKAQQDHNDRLGLSKEAIAELDAASLELQATKLDSLAIDRLVQYQSEIQYNLYKDQAAELRKLADLKRAGGVKESGIDAVKSIDAYLDPAKAQSFGDALKNSFGGAGDALDKMVNSLADYTQKQAELAKMQKALADNPGIGAAKRIELETGLSKKQAEIQIGAYADMAGAAKGFFDQNSAGYKVLDGVEKAMHLVQMANLYEKLFTSLFVSTASASGVVSGQAVETGSVVAAQAVQNTAKIPGVFMSFMSAIGPWGAAAAAIAIAAVLGSVGGGGSTSVTLAPGKDSTGAGGVFGDPKAVDNSISKSLELLTALAKPELSNTSRMVALLTNIDQNLAGTSNALTASGFNEQAAAYQGVNLSALGAPSQFSTAMVPGGDPYLGSLAGKIGNLLFGGNTTENSSSIGAGLQFDPNQSLAASAANLALENYTKVQHESHTDGGWFGSDSSSSWQTIDKSKSDPKVVAAMQSVLSSSMDYMTTLGRGLGLSDAQISGATSAGLGIDRVDLKGLTIQEQKDKLSAVIGDALSTVAKNMAPQFEPFIKGGETYLTTLSRVYAGMENAALITDRLGLKTVALADLKNKQGDVASELVRQSIVDSETTRTPLGKGMTVSLGGMFGGVTVELDKFKEDVSSVGTIIQNFTGTASDLADLYTNLVNVRTALVSMGFSAGTVTTDLLRGAGGIDALKGGIKDFQSGFLTQEEQLNAKKAAMGAEFSKLGLAVPATADGFKALVLSLKGGDAASQELLGRVLVLSGGMKDLTDSMTAATKAILDGAMNDVTKAVAAQKTVVTNAYNAATKAADAQKTAVTNAYNEQAKSVKDSLDTVTGSVGKLKTLANTLKSALDGMRISGSEATYRADAQAQISAALATARAGGGLPVDGQLASALQTVAKPSEQLYSTFQDYARDFYKTANDISALSEITGSQASVQQTQLDALNTQTQVLKFGYDAQLVTLNTQTEVLKAGYDAEIIRLDSVVSSAQAQIDAVNGVNTSVLSVEAAIAGLQSALGLERAWASSSVTTDAKAADSAQSVVAAKTAATARAAQAAADAQTVQAAAAQAAEQAAKEKAIAKKIELSALFDNYQAELKKLDSIPQTTTWENVNSSGTAENPAYAQEKSAVAAALSRYNDSLKSFDVGTNSVPYDMMANIHKDERIVPAADNRELMARLRNPASNNDMLVAEIRALRSEVAGLRASSERGNENTQRAADTLQGRQGVPFLVQVAV